MQKLSRIILNRSYFYRVGIENWGIVNKTFQQLQMKGEERIISSQATTAFIGEIVRKSVYYLAD